jgi:hypothetical protein
MPDRSTVRQQPYDDVTRFARAAAIRHESVRREAVRG